MARSATSSTPDETGTPTSRFFRLRELFGSHHLFVELQYFGYEPHQEARAGQGGAPVYEKIRAEDNRLRHRTAVAPPGATTVAATTAYAPAVDGNGINMHDMLSATLVASLATTHGGATCGKPGPHPPI